MNVNKLVLMYVSPNGTTRTTLQNIAKGLEISEVEELDLTSFDSRFKEISISADALVLVGMPVYMGRLIPVQKEIFNYVKGQGNPTVPVVVYGNRDYDDALLELKDKLTQINFSPIAAGAFIAQHSFNSNIAHNRPDESDVEKQISFGAQIKKKLDSLATLENIELNVKGNYPYKVYADIPLCPTTNDKCSDCGICIDKCPVKAIDPSDVSKVDNFRCIICNKCVNECQNQGREITNQQFKTNIIKLQSMTSMKRNEAELFI